MQKEIVISDREEAVKLFGPHDNYLKMIRNYFDVEMSVRNSVIKIRGDQQNVRNAARVISELRQILKVRDYIIPGDVEEVIASIVQPRMKSGVSRVGRLTSTLSWEPRSKGQAEYVEAIYRSDIVFSIGPAGTGKTYLAVAVALEHLREGSVKRLVLVRPAVEAGEKLGFLPGDYQAKVNPYLRPLYDALGNLLEFEQMRKLMEAEIIEIAPLAYMRGRTLDAAFVILDEAQNTTSDQMKMFLTRMGLGSKMVVTGDITQIDLPPSIPSGLVEVQTILSNIQGVEFVYLTKEDIVRHHLVQHIVDAYARISSSRRGTSSQVVSRSTHTGRRSEQDQ